jgi:hypothetical protein
MASVMPMQCVISFMAQWAGILYFCAVHRNYDLISCEFADGSFMQAYGRFLSYDEVTILHVIFGRFTHVYYEFLLYVEVMNLYIVWMWIHAGLLQIFV